ncbi:MAG: DUF167 domain-containing protein [Terriglobales bacterium]
MIPIRESAGGVTFAVKVHPRAKKNAIAGELGDALKLALTAPPVEGKANEACIEFFSNLLEVPRSSVTIAAGQTSRNKVIRVAGLSAAKLEKRLNLRSPA